MRSNARRWLVIMSLIGGVTSIFAVGGAMAGPIEDIPSSMATSLGTTSDIAKMILSSAILAGVGLTMSMVGRKANLLPTIVVLISTEGVLTGIGWLTPWLLLFTAILIAALFGGAIRDSLGV